MSDLRDRNSIDQSLMDPASREAQAFRALLVEMDQIRPALQLDRLSQRDRSVTANPAIGVWRKGVFAALAMLLLSIPYSRLRDHESNSSLNEFTASSDQLFDPYASDWPAQPIDPTSRQNEP